MQDTVGEAVACNCIGVDYMLIASPPTDAGTLLGFKSSATSIRHLNEAVQYHKQHFYVSDNGGKYVAHINLGLCYGMLGDITNAAKHYQDALRIAIKMQTLYGQSIAVGNLGMLALVKKDLVTSRTCFQQVRIHMIPLTSVGNHYFPCEGKTNLSISESLFNLCLCAY